MFRERTRNVNIQMIDERLISVRQWLICWFAVGSGRERAEHVSNFVLTLDTSQSGAASVGRMHKHRNNHKEENRRDKNGRDWFGWRAAGDGTDDDVNKGLRRTIFAMLANH